MIVHILYARVQPSIYIYYYRIIKKTHLRGCFVIGSGEPSFRKQTEAKVLVPQGFHGEPGPSVPWPKPPNLLEKIRTPLGTA